MKPEEEKNPGMASAAMVQALDHEAIEKTFQADVMKLTMDMAAWGDYMAKVTHGKRQQAISKLLKVKAENRRGSQLVVEWMTKNARFSANAYNEEHLCIMEVGGPEQQSNT